MAQTFEEWIGSPQGMALGQGLLSVAGPSVEPRSIMEGFAAGGQNMQVAAQNEYQKRLQDMNLRKLAMQEKQLGIDMAQKAKAREYLDQLRAGNGITAADFLQGSIAGGTPSELDLSMAPTFAPLNQEAKDKLSSQAFEFEANPGLLSQAMQDNAGRKQEQQKQLLADYYFAAGSPEKGLKALGYGDTAGDEFTLSEGQTRFDANGKPIATAAKTEKPKEMSTSQAAVATYADRAYAANSAIGKYGKAGLSLEDQMKSMIPVYGNKLVSDDFQQLQQAQLNFVNAVLRRESGAAISDAEFTKAELQYFPKPYDNPGTLRQKKKNREDVMNGLAREAGSLYKRPTSGSREETNYVSQAIDSEYGKLSDSELQREIELESLTQRYGDKVSPDLIKAYQRNKAR